jgi:hypothetical protein
MNTRFTVECETHIATFEVADAYREGHDDLKQVRKRSTFWMPATKVGSKANEACRKRQAELIHQFGFGIYYSHVCLDDGSVEEERYYFHTNPGHRRRNCEAVLMSLAKKEIS